MIEIKNELLLEILKFELSKEDNFFSNDELNSFEEIIIDSVGFESKYNDIDIQELVLLKNLEVIEFHNTNFTNEDLVKLNKLNLNKLHFYKCNFQSVKQLINYDLKVLGFTFCHLEDLKYINNINCLEELYLEGFNNLDLEDISIIKNLKQLSLRASRVDNQELLIFLSNVENLRLDHSNIKSLSFCLSLPYLKRLIVSDDMYLPNQEIINNLHNNGVLVIDPINQKVVDYDV